MRKIEVLGRTVLVFFGCIAAVGLLEAGLQLGALVLKLTATPTPISWLTGGRRILCLGDSNTYGVRLERREEQAWPSRLESLWNQAGHVPPVEVLNVSYPGTNSSRLLRDFPEMLDVFRPDLVLVMVGVNDGWTASVPVASTSETEGCVAFLRRHSRVYKLFTLMSDRVVRAQGGELEVRVEVRPDEIANEDATGRGVARFRGHEFALGWSKELAPKAPPRWLGELRHNLEALVSRAQERGVELVLLTYPARHKAYGQANGVIRRAAEETEAPLVDLERLFAPLCEDEECLEWFFRDHHPRAEGHQLAARTIVEALGERRRP
jgi:lysophospholipase L1-like esterase